MCRLTRASELGDLLGCGRVGRTCTATNLIIEFKGFENVEDERGLDIHAEARVVDEELVEPPSRHALQLDDEAADGRVGLKVDAELFVGRKVDTEAFPDRAGRQTCLPRSAAGRRRWVSGPEQ